MADRDIGAEIREAMKTGDIGALVAIAFDLHGELVELRALATATERRRTADRERKKNAPKNTSAPIPRNSAEGNGVHRNSAELLSVSSKDLGSSGGSESSFKTPTLRAAVGPPNGAKPPRSDPPLPSAPKRRSKARPYTPEFEEWWAAYPAEYRGTKSEAFEQWWRRRSEGHTGEVMTSGRDRYVAQSRALNRHMKHASTFLGPAMHFLEPWPLPTQQTKPAAPETEEQRQNRIRRMSLAVEGRKQRRDGEEWWAYVESEARESGATSTVEILEFAYKQLTPEVARAG